MQKRPKEKYPLFELIPRGAFCDHRRMCYTSCECCKPKTCAVECPDCDLYWMLNEGIHG